MVAKTASDLLNKNGMFGSVLHLYHSMVARKFLKPVQLIEQLCIILKEQVFMDACTNENKLSIFRHFLGASIEQDVSNSRRMNVEKFK